MKQARITDKTILAALRAHGVYGFEAVKLLAYLLGKHETRAAALAAAVNPPYRINGRATW